MIEHRSNLKFGITIGEWVGIVTLVVGGIIFMVSTGKDVEANSNDIQEYKIESKESLKESEKRVTDRINKLEERVIRNNETLNRKIDFLISQMKNKG